MCSSEVICLCQRLYSIQAFCGLEKGNISMITIQAQTKRTPSGYNWNIFMVNLKKNHQSSPLCPAFWWNTPITFFWEARRETVRFFAASFLFQLFCFVVSRKQEKKNVVQCGLVKGYRESMRIRKTSGKRQRIYGCRKSIRQGVHAILHARLL